MLKVLILSLFPFFNDGVKLIISKADMKRYWGIYPPSNLHDGITNNFAHSFDETDGMWVRVNLAYHSSIKKILIYNRKECCQTRIVGASVYIKAGEKDVKKCGTIASTKTLYSFDCEGEGDSVEIRQEGFVNQWNIAEIEVYDSSFEEEKKILSPKYIVLFVAAILAGTVSAIYYFHNRQQNSTSEEQHEQTREAISDAPVAAVTHCGSSPPNPSVVNVDQSNENMNETRFEEPAPALGTDNLPPPQYEYQGLPLKDDEIPSYEEVMANDHIYQKPV